MTTIDFLFQIQTEHFYRSGLNDLDAFLFDFDRLETSVIEEIIQRLHLTKEEFLTKVRQDLKNATEEEMTKLAEIIEASPYAKDNVLLSIIRKTVYYYAVSNPKFDINKYFKSFCLGFVSDIRKDLYSDIIVHFDEAKDTKNLAATSDDYTSMQDTHQLQIYINNVPKKKVNAILEILGTLYHEEYHMLVDEMEINPNCFKTNILNYQKVDAYRHMFKKDDFYRKYYTLIQEEIEAEIYGFHMAYKRIKELNPDFPFSKVPDSKFSEILWANENQFATTFKIGFLKRVQQKKYIDEQLDVFVKKNPEYIYGMLSRVYNKNGTRKNFKELVMDYINILNNNKEVPPEEITDFYAELLYDAYKKSNEEEREELSNDNFYHPYVLQCLSRKEELLEKEVQNMNLKQAASLMSALKRALKKKLINKDLKELKQYLMKNEEVVSYGL